MIFKKFILSLVLITATFAAGFLVSRFFPVCGDGLRESGEDLQSCPQDCGVKIYPFETDAKECFDASGKLHPSTGVGAAQWFYFGCGQEKIYRVEPGRTIAMMLTGDEKHSWHDHKPAFSIWEEAGGKWWEMQTVESEKSWELKNIIPYTPKSNKIKIKAGQLFYLDVYGPKGIGKDVMQSEAEQSVVTGQNEPAEYINPEFKFKVRTFTNEQVFESPARDDVAFFDSAYGRSPLDKNIKTPAVSVRVKKCWGQGMGDCLSKSRSPCDGLIFNDICNSRFNNYTRTKFSWTSSKKQIQGYPTVRVEIICGDNEYQGVAVIKNDMIYSIMFLSASKKYLAFPVEKGEQMIDSFGFTEGQ